MKKGIYLFSSLYLLVSCTINIGPGNSNSNNIDSLESDNGLKISIKIPGSSITSSSDSISSNSSLNSRESITSLSSSFSSSNSTWENSEVEKYYVNIDFSLTGTKLLASLEKLLDSTDNETFTYKGLFDVFKYSDADPDNVNSGYIVSFYSGNKAKEGSMNREHTWPNSRGGFLLEKDPHVIRPTINAENSARGNSFFNENGSWDPASFDNPKYRGIAARIIFYGACKAYSEGLYLVDKTDDPRLSSTNSITKKNWNPTMGKLSTLLKWNLEYDIDDTEILRNDVLYNKFNHCRNPFIDNRDLACQIWGDTNDETAKVCNKNK